MSKSRLPELLALARENRRACDERRPSTVPRSGKRVPLVTMLRDARLRQGAEPAQVIDEHGNLWG